MAATRRRKWTYTEAAAKQIAERAEACQGPGVFHVKDQAIPVTVVFGRVQTVMSAFPGSALKATPSWYLLIQLVHRIKRLKQVMGKSTCK